MKNAVIFSILASLSFNAKAMCDKRYFSSAEKAGERVSQLIGEKNQQATYAERKGLKIASPKIQIIVRPKNIVQPCSTGKDQFYIQVDGLWLNEGDLSQLGFH